MRECMRGLVWTAVAFAWTFDQTLAVTISSNWTASGLQVLYVDRAGYRSPVTGSWFDGEYADETASYTISVPSGHKATVRIDYVDYVSSNGYRYLQVYDAGGDYATDVDFNGSYEREFTSTSTIVLRARPIGTDYLGNKNLRCYFDISVTYESLYPDLMIPSVVTEPTREAARNETKTLNFTVRNFGGTKSVATTARVRDGALSLGVFQVPELMAGQSMSFDMDISSLPAGSHVLTVSVDGVPGELSTANNSESVSLSVYENVPYVVRFDPAGGAGAPAEQDMTYGIPQALRANTFKRDGFIFVGWNEPMTGLCYSDGQAVSDLSHVQNAQVTLYAIWRKAPTIRFDGMGAAGTMPDMTFSAERMHLPPNRYVRDDGLVFVGWSRFAHEAPLYFDGQEVTLKALTYSSDDDESELTLYAAWGRAFTYRGLTFYTGRGGENAMTWMNGSYAFWGPGGKSQSYQDSLVYSLHGTASNLAQTWICLVADTPGQLDFECIGTGGSENSLCCEMFDGMTLQQEFLRLVDDRSSAYSLLVGEGRHLIGWSAYGRTECRGALNNGFCWSPGRVVSFDSCGGGKIDVKWLVTSGQPRQMNDDAFSWSTATLPDAKRSGCVFDGWYTARYGGQRISAPGELPADVTCLYAHWTGNIPSSGPYSICYQLSGGSFSGSTPPATAMPGFWTVLESPTREGCVFGGWQAVAGLDTTCASVSTDGVTAYSWTSPSAAVGAGLGAFVFSDLTRGGETVTLKALWTPRRYEIICDPDGGTLDAGTPMLVGEGEWAVLPSPVREGYDFGGWQAVSGLDTTCASISIDGAVAYNWWPTEAIVGAGLPAFIFSNLTRIGGTVTLKALWIERKYNLAYELDGGTAYPGTPTSAKIGEWLVLPSPTKAGYCFGGWQAVSGLDTTCAVLSTDGITAYQWWPFEAVVGAGMDAFVINNLGRAGGTVTLKALWTR